MTKRILHIFGTMNRGGAEMRTLSLMQKMREQGVQFDFCVLSGQVGVLDQEIRRLGGQVYYCKLGLGFIPRFLALLRQHKFAGVHSHVAYVSGFILLLSRIAGIKLRIAHFRNTTDGADDSFIRKIRNHILRGLIATCATHILAVCIGAMRGFWGTAWEKDAKCQVIYNGFEVPTQPTDDSFWPKYIPNYQGQKIIVNVARMDVQKNHLRQCQIFIELLNTKPDCLMVFIGKEDVQRKAAMTDLLAKHGVSTKVIFLGLQSDVMPFLQHADLMLFPSLWEGLPGVVLEASSVGLPVLASDLSGIEEIAQQISSVHIQTLKTTDLQWAQQLAKMLDNGFDKTHNIEQFKHSSFLMTRNIDKLYAVYSE